MRLRRRLRYTRMTWSTVSEDRIATTRFTIVGSENNPVTVMFRQQTFEGERALIWAGPLVACARVTIEVSAEGMAIFSHGMKNRLR